MSGWQGWPLERFIVLFTGLAYIMIFVQVFLFHYRQNFRHWAQWLPVIALPLISLVGLALSVTFSQSLRLVFAISLIAALVAGLIGFYFHLKGVGKRVDGYRFHNFLVGPPIIIPLMISAVAVLGLAALYWS